MANINGEKVCLNEEFFLVGLSLDEITERIIFGFLGHF